MNKALLLVFAIITTQLQAHIYETLHNQEKRCTNITQHIVQGACGLKEFVLILSN